MTRSGIDRQFSFEETRTVDIYNEFCTTPIKFHRGEFDVCDPASVIMDRADFACVLRFVQGHVVNFANLKHGPSNPAYGPSSPGNVQRPRNRTLTPASDTVGHRRFSIGDMH